MLAPLVEMMCIEMMTFPNGVAGEEEFEDWGKGWFLSWCIVIFLLSDIVLTNLFFFQDKIFDLAAKAEKPLAKFIPEAMGWMKEAAEDLVPYAKEDWKEWGQEWLLPSLFILQHSLDYRRVTSEEEKLTQRRQVEEEFSVALQGAMDHEANQTK
jgi:hypothetical protein